MRCPICGREFKKNFEVSVYWSLTGLSKSEMKTLDKHDVGFTCPSNTHDNFGWHFLLLNGIWFVFTMDGYNSPSLKRR